MHCSRLVPDVTHINQVLYEQLDQELAYFGITLLELAEQGKQLAWLETGTQWTQLTRSPHCCCYTHCCD